MKRQLAYTIAALAFVPVSSVIAECDINLPYNELVDCILVEDSGANYQKWKANFNNEYSEQQEDC